MSMVVFSGLKCRKCGTRVAVAVTPDGKAFSCPLCQAPMRAQAARDLASALGLVPDVLDDAGEWEHDEMSQVRPGVGADVPVPDPEGDHPGRGDHLTSPRP